MSLKITVHSQTFRKPHLSPPIHVYPKNRESKERERGQERERQGWESEQREQWTDRDREIESQKSKQSYRLES